MNVLPRQSTLQRHRAFRTVAIAIIAVELSVCFAVNAHAQSRVESSASVPANRSARTATQPPVHRQPKTIPTVVALSAPSMTPGLGPVNYFEGRVPAEWPVALLPVGGKILGGSTSGIAGVFEMKTAVFDLGATDATTVLRTMATRAGYVLRNPRNKTEGIGGFVESPTPPDAFAYCKAESFLIGGCVDSVQSPTVYFLTTLEGGGARSNCEPDPARSGALPSVGVPTLVAPAGVRTVGGGSSSTGTGGMSVSTLMTTLPVDSLLSHFRAQLVAAGWTVTGAPAMTDGVAIQRFVFRDRTEPWTGALTVLAAGDKRDVHLLYTRNP